MKTFSPESLLLISVLVAAVPLLIAVGTCYLKFSIVLSLLRSGFGTQQAPSGALVLALSVVLSLVVMQPVLEQTGARLQETKIGEPGQLSFLTARAAVEQVVQPWREFLLAHAEARELTVFTALAAGAAPQPLGAARATPPSAGVPLPTAPAVAPPAVGVNPAPPRFSAILGAYVLSEIKRGFLMAFFLLLPFFVIDVVVANLLVSLGLTMLSPVVVTLPLKLLLFISSDGWLLLAQSLVRSYQ